MDRCCIEQAAENTQFAKLSAAGTADARLQSNKCMSPACIVARAQDHDRKNDPTISINSKFVAPQIPTT
jgi:hypothetical protein